MKVASESVVPIRLVMGLTRLLLMLILNVQLRVLHSLKDPSKRVKVDPGLQSFCAMSPDTASSIPNIETAGSAGHPDEEFKPNAAMEEMIINFFIRVRILLIVLLCSA
ncbi:hypothetical protein V6N13_029690 [Hibiscus sabdariffa]|uniref:Uncharacterized protein n=1 Tax=Hibiscus sabdariffa TaxID=183260 RepID=A0ABR2TA54_9ROSI